MQQPEVRPQALKRGGAKGQVRASLGPPEERAVGAAPEAPPGESGAGLHCWLIANNLTTLELFENRWRSGTPGSGRWTGL
ncbi:unnamed protein product [Prorocentrum cordatum]|uniref:Uncharacterized protein n=1 Tax=Prorocentrum cordatum TaxID=2364126 RepID=A0ABN9VUX3_9DINO|nr:unnamed protein product [Polarella glacialis]